MKQYIIIDQEGRTIATDTLAAAREIKRSFNEALTGDIRESPAAIYAIDDYMAYIFAQNEMTIPDGLGDGEKITEVK